MGEKYVGYWIMLNMKEITPFTIYVTMKVINNVMLVALKGLYWNIYKIFMTLNYLKNLYQGGN